MGGVPVGSNLPSRSIHESSWNAAKSFGCMQKPVTASHSGERGIVSTSLAYCDTCTLTILAIGQTSPILFKALTASRSRSWKVLATDRDVSSVYAGRWTIAALEIAQVKQGVCTDSGTLIEVIFDISFAARIALDVWAARGRTGAVAKSPCEHTVSYGFPSDVRLDRGRCSKMIAQCTII